MRSRFLAAAGSIALIVSTFFPGPSQATGEMTLTPYEPCEITNQAPCIESLTLIDSNGKRTKAIPGGPTSALTYEFAGQKSTPTTTYQWYAPGIKHENKIELMTLHVYHFPLGAKYCWSETDCTTNVDETVIYLFASGWGVPAPTIDFIDRENDLLCGTAEKPEKCIRMWGLNEDYQYEVSLRPLPSFDFSHANGEAKNGKVRVSVNAKGERIITFTGEPVVFSYNVVTPLKPKDPSQQRADASYAYIGVYAHTTQSGQSEWLKGCDYGREMSLWYSGQLQSMPMWLAADSTLTLQVASTHYRADNSKNLGVFNIEMPIETAKCLWGVDLSKSVSATVAAAYPELGISEIVTTTSKVEGKFFKVSAAGFHYSAPVIKVKVTQEKIKLVAKKTTITCVKGKVVKKVTAISPQCPSGYKKR
ncbi:MAG: hypothetical protein ACKOPU_02040 [Candidatus Planktophila sp.]